MIYIIHKIDKKNTGDMLSSYHLYFPVKSTFKHVDIDNINPNNINKNDIIIFSGGGLFNCVDKWNNIINQIINKSNFCYAFGVGFNDKYDIKNKYKNIKLFKYMIDFSKFKIVGCRDYIFSLILSIKKEDIFINKNTITIKNNTYIENNNIKKLVIKNTKFLINKISENDSFITFLLPNFEYVPCSSCMLKDFDNFTSNNINKIGIIYHKDVNINLNYEKISNSSTKDEIFTFLENHNFIITNSYHIIYFCKLLNIKCLYYKKNSEFKKKFNFFRYKIIEWNNNNFSDIKENIKYLLKSRDIVKSFYYKYLSKL